MTDHAHLRGNWLVWGSTAYNLDRVRSVSVVPAAHEEHVLYEGTGEDRHVTGTHDVAVRWHLVVTDADGRLIPVSDEFTHEGAARDALLELLSPWDAFQAVT